MAEVLTEMLLASVLKAINPGVPIICPLVEPPKVDIKQNRKKQQLESKTPCVSKTVSSAFVYANI